MNLTLLKMWNGLPIGFQLVGVQVGQAELMLRYGTAVQTVEQIALQQNDELRSTGTVTSDTENIYRRQRKR